MRAENEKLRAQLRTERQPVAWFKREGEREEVRLYGDMRLESALADGWIPLLMPLLEGQA